MKAPIYLDLSCSHAFFFPSFLQNKHVCLKNHSYFMRNQIRLSTFFPSKIIFFLKTIFNSFMWNQTTLDVCPTTCWPCYVVPGLLATSLHCTRSLGGLPAIVVWCLVMLNVLQLVQCQVACLQNNFFCILTSKLRGKEIHYLSMWVMWCW